MKLQNHRVENFRNVLLQCDIAVAHGAYYQKAEGLVHGIDPSRSYYAVHVTVDYGEITSSSASFGDKLEDITLYFEDLNTRDSFITLFNNSKLVTDNNIRFDI